MNEKGTGKTSKRTASKTSKLQHLQFFAYFRCHRIPKILFTRAARSLRRWGDDGELNSTGGRYNLRLQLSHSGTHSDITAVTQEAENSGIVRVEGKSWAQWYTVKSTWKKLSANENTSDCAKSNYFIILGLVSYAFPEAWSEICWEEVENQLLEVIQSTCVPFLAVLDEADIKEYLAHYTSGLKRQWLILFLKLLLRLSLVMEKRTPPNFPTLILGGLEILRGLGVEALEEVSYIELGASIVKIQKLNETQPWVAAEDLNALVHNASQRSNSSIGFALGSLPSSWMTYDNKLYWDFMQWTPLSKIAPSTMEVLAQAVIAGASSFTQFPGIMWPALSLEAKVLIGFYEATRGSPQQGCEILEDLIEEVKASYGSDSMEFLLAGITLVNCCNKAYGGRAEEIGRAIFQSIYGSTVIPVRIDVPQQTYLLMAVADTFLGQGNYAEAELLLRRVIEYPFTDSITEMSARLRQLKIGRRLRRSPLDIDDWKILQYLAACFHLATDSLKYEILEEAICFISVVKSEDIPRGPLEPLIFETIKSLSNASISEYGGSSASKKNFIDNIDALQQYKNKLDLFSLTGPQLYFCRMIRERFRHTTVQVAERVGAANWKRFQRIKEMWEEDDSSENIIAQDENQDTGKSKFQDSGIGSSIGSEAKMAGHSDSGVPPVARSTISFRSFIQNEYGAAVLPPIPAENEEGNRICFICKKILKDVNTESQWRRHAFQDLRPYVCIVEGCDVNPVKFSSRSDFATHLMSHQHISTWICPTCGQSNEDQTVLKEHLRQIHQSSLTKHAPLEERRILRDLSSQECPFCGEIPGATSFVGHICHHLEEISLSAVPNGDEDFDEDAEEDLARDSSALGSMSSGSEELEDSLSNEVNASPPRALKTQEQIRLEIQEKVKKAAEADKAKQEKEEKELERQIREMEEMYAESDKKEAELLAKRAAEAAKAKKTQDEKDKADAAENDRKLREAEREMERLEDERERKRAEAEAQAGAGR